MPHTIVHEASPRTTFSNTQSLHFGSSDETFERRTQGRQYNPNVENRSSLENILARTIVNEDGRVTTNITKQ